MEMLNRLTVWLLCFQVGYVTLFALLVVVDKVSGGSVFRATVGLRKVLHLENNLVRLSDYLYYPMNFTVPLNLILMLVFCGTLLRKKRTPALGADFFSILNALFLSPCLIILLLVFIQWARR